ncbi:MAG: RIP metalloprotease RseP [Roseivirga sp.]
MVTQFLLGLSIVAGLHELGHLLFAKLFGMRVETYTIGFSPKLFRFQWGETEYALGLLPLGGAVKITGMIDESMDTAELASAPQPWEFRAKPAWQRLVVMLGGILFNVVTGIIIFIALTFTLGDTYLSKQEVNKHGIVPNALGKTLGFQEGDQIVAIHGQDFEKFNDILKPATLLAANGYYTVLREGQTVRIAIPPDMIERLADHKGQEGFVMPRMPFAVGTVQSMSGAAQAGLQPGDHIVAIADQPTLYFHQLKQVLADKAGQQVMLQYRREDTLHTTTAQISEEGTLGFQPSLLLTHEKQYYSLGQAVVVGTLRAYTVIETNIMALSKIFTGQLSPTKSLSGPIGIAQIFGKSFDWIQFWSVTGFLSLVLALTNLLPIPALDGGHALWIVCEMITGRRLSDKFLLNAQMVGMAILLFLITYAVVNDLYRLFQH